jgi:hypothetical protein
MVDLDPAFGEQLFDIAVGEPVTQVPPDRTTITSAGNRNPANADRGGDQGRVCAACFTGQACRDLPTSECNRAELGEDALRALFGFIVEGLPDPGDLDPYEVPLRGSGSPTRPAANRPNARPPRRYQMMPDGTLQEIGDAEA